ncbi:FAD-binding protein [Desulfitobacterium sp. PCE1]|uniref:FAD-binding protein n=1 Tax=Desulfitobacterium sp. PCE1 TaxID=146907 RepID=UPI00035E95BC|nr:FAD-binding protein [Desulfitobacterium sp. PCE1]
MNKRFKKIISLLICLAMLFTLTACSSSTNTPKETPKRTSDGLSFTPGTYAAEAPGRNGILKLEVTVDESRILSVKVLEHSETAMLSDAPIQQIPQKIVEGQTLKVDTIAGASLTSGAILAAAKEALTKAGGDINKLMQGVEKEKIQVQDAETDIVVVGAGAAGMIAAIKASALGKDVILVEKMGMLGGGDTMMASTLLNAAGSSVQKELSIPNSSAEDFYKQLDGIATQKNMPADRTTLKTYADRSGAMVDWLVDLGVPFGRITNTFQHKIKDGSAPGTHIVAALSKELDAKKVDYRLNTKATSIIMEDGKATGIEIETPDGNYKIKAKAVIVTTGGFSNNPELLAKYNPTWLNRPTTGSASLTGDGIIMAEKVGAALYNMDQVKANYLAHVLEDGSAVSLTAINNHTVLVNHDGKRFVNEDHGSINYKSEQMMMQKGHEAYAIFDQTVIEDLKLMKGYNDSGYFISADTLEGLADKIDVNKENFLKTMKDYQSYTINGEDKEFGRKISDPIDKPKYYAALVTPSMQSTYGGIKVDETGHVISTEGKVIPGLYAAGATSGHGAAAGEVGYALIVAVVFGDVVGEQAATDIK